MQRQNSRFAKVKRSLLVVSLTGVIAIVGCEQVATSYSLGVLGIAGVGGTAGAVSEPEKSTIPEGAVESRTIHPSQATWSWVTSDGHYGAGAVLSGDTCVKCHKDPAAQSRLWPYWGNPPVNHKEGAGCQTCHAVAPKPE